MAEQIVGVYKFTNKASKRVYIGSSEHVWYNYYQHTRKFGIGAKKGLFFPEKYFSFEILKVCGDEREAWLWQTFYIIKYNSAHKDKGYNGKIAPVKYSTFVKNMNNGYFGEIFDKPMLNRIVFT